jgi:hypothetical protein
LREPTRIETTRTSVAAPAIKAARRFNVLNIELRLRADRNLKNILYCFWLKIQSQFSGGVGRRAVPSVPPMRGVFKMRPSQVPIGRLLRSLRFTGFPFADSS